MIKINFKKNKNMIIQQALNYNLNLKKMLVFKNRLFQIKILLTL